MAELLEAKQLSCIAQFDDIVERFANANDIADDPEKLSAAMKTQKRHIVALMANKDECIEKLRSEYTRLDADYEANLLKQRNDIHYVYLRMNAHLEAMRASYVHYLQLLRNTIDAEREKLTLTARRQWTEMHERNGEDLDRKHRVEQEKRAFYGAQLERVRLEQTEQTRAARIQLQRDEQAVHMELQQVRAACMLNSEKFDYNYQILAKKGDENVTVRNQQKRKLAQLREQVLEQRQQIRTIRANFEQASAKCKNEVVRFHSSFMELETRADRYALINDKKFTHVWDMNESEARALLTRVLAIDKVLFEQQLGHPWPEPELVPLNKEDLDSYREAKQKLHHAETGAQASHPDSQSRETVLSISEEKASYPEQMLADTRVLRIILRQITEETDFLVEAKLMKLLRPYLQPVQSNIVQVDHIFQALGIESMRDVSTLIKHFVPYAWCTVCSMENMETDTTTNASGRTTRTTSIARKSSARQTRSTNDTNDFVDADLAAYIEDFERANEADTYTRKSFYPSSALPDGHMVTDDRPPITPCDRHTLAIQTGCVLKVFRQYARACLNANTKAVVGGIGERTQATSMAARLVCERSTVSRMIDGDDVQLFWQRYRDVFTVERQRLWESLESGLKEYLRVLQRREQLNTECEFLRRQNAELRHMLQPYLDGQQK